MCRPEYGENCINTTETLIPRLGHASIVYRTYDYEWCAKFVEIDNCAEFNKANLTCPYCVNSDENREQKNKLTNMMKENGYWLGPESPMCPPICCPIDEDNPRTECKRTMGQHGHAINVDQEIMLVFGGLVQRDRFFRNEETDEELDIFNYCEDYERITGEDFPYFLRTCGEELVRDIWIYNIKDNFWTFVKPDANLAVYLYVKQPTARHGHAGTYVEL